MAAQPEELRRREARERAVAGERDQPLEPDALLDLGALGPRALVVPEDRGPDDPVGGVEGDEAVHLAGETDPGDLARRSDPGLSSASATASRATSPPDPAPTSPACGVESGYPCSATPATRPSGATAIAFTPVVPTSSPTSTSVGSAAMDVLRLAEGLWRWTTHYEEWRHDVGCVYYEAPDAIVLIDPLVPEEPSEAARFWEALDRDVKHANVPVHVYITIFWHARSAGEVVRRYDGRLHATSRARAANERRTGVATEAFRPGDPLPGGIEALASGRAAEVVYWIPEHRAIVPGDVLLGDDDGGLRLCPESWLPAGADHARLRAALKPCSTCRWNGCSSRTATPVTVDARAKLAEALAGD